MVHIKGSLTSHSTDKEAAHPALPTVRTVSPNTPASRGTAALMPSLRTHSHLADIQEQDLQDWTLKALAKKSKHIPAIQPSSNSGVRFTESYSSALGASSIRSTLKDHLLPTGVRNFFMKPSNTYWTLVGTTRNTRR